MHSKYIPQPGVGVVGTIFQEITNLYNDTEETQYSGASLLWTLWDLDFSPSYRGFLNPEVI